MRPAMKSEADRDVNFARWVKEIHGAEHVKECIQCGVCSGSCPLGMYMDYSPRRLIHIAKEGFREEVLGSHTIWLCTSCYACTVSCPREIKVTDIIYALKRRAIEEKVYPRRFPIAILAQEFGKMVRGKGRVSETWLVMNVFMRTNILKTFGMTKLGMNLMRTGRFSLKSESVKNRGQIEKLMKALETSKEGAA
jgi:quinone-modifying oxidoreductase subunit QmoC